MRQVEPRRRCHDAADARYDGPDDGGHGPRLASRPRRAHSRDRGARQIPVLQMTAAVSHAGERSVPWLRGLRVYIATMAGGNLVWESLHLPLYTIWRNGTAPEQAFAVLHCTLGDVLIALSTLMLALIAAGDDGWPE